jgi:3-polyprenyl-4-hydroxybenzoate decarboxylase
MKRIVSVCLAFVFLCSTAPRSVANPRQVLPGTQVRLALLNPIGTASSRDGDPFVATVAEPVFLGNQLLIPAGARVNGIIGTVGPTRRFSVIRGQAYMALTFRSIELDSRVIPVQMSIISIAQPSGEPEGKRRKDVKVDEGTVVEEKHDFKGDVVGGSIGTGGAAVVGAIFSHVVRGFGLGLAGTAAYVMIRKGKDVVLPAQTLFLVRMDNTVTLPVMVSDSTPARATLDAEKR